MKTIYEIDQYAYPTGKTRTIGDRDPIPLGWVDAEPPASDSYRWVGVWQSAPTRQAWLNRPQILGPAKEAKQQEARKQYQAVLERGFTDANGVTWQATQDARDRVLDLTQRIQEYRAGKVSSALPNGKTSVKLTDASGARHDADANQIVSIAEQGSDFKDTAEDRLEELLGQIEAATSHSDLDAIDVTSGWPSSSSSRSSAVSLKSLPCSAIDTT